MPPGHSGELETSWDAKPGHCRRVRSEVMVATDRCPTPRRLAGPMPDIQRPIDAWLQSGNREVRMGDEMVVAADAPAPSRRTCATAVVPDTMFAALWRGLRSRCPSCGQARLFGAFLKPIGCCPGCGQDMRHQRADDFPPYIVILLLGHLIVPGMAAVEMNFHPPMWVQLAIWLPLILLLGIGLLQPVKGAVIAYQWWHGMGGFEGRSRAIPLSKDE